MVRWGGMLVYGQQKNTFPGRKRVRKYPTILYGMGEKILKYALYL